MLLIKYLKMKIETGTIYLGMVYTVLYGEHTHTHTYIYIYSNFILMTRLSDDVFFVGI